MVRITMIGIELGIKSSKQRFEVFFLRDYSKQKGENV